jgi:hypothetical protein
MDAHSAFSPNRKSPGAGLAVVNGETYKLFQVATAHTTYVLGEFPWQVRVGESVRVEDYIKVPRMLSAEITGNEVTWSLGEYIAGKDIWTAFQLPGSAPQAQGIYPNQPSPYTAVSPARGRPSPGCCCSG